MNMIEAHFPEAQSADLIANNIAALSALFPELLTEGAGGVEINVDVLKQLVGKVATDADEKYGLNWHGKRRARQLALTPSNGTLRPCVEESVDWDTTQNLMIEGDNLEVLKLLQKSYAGKVKLIYIDPPYNTGKDFVYPDNFQDNIKNYLELTGQLDGGAKISSNTESSGRFHTDWLNMMYPRLKLARNLLQDDGAIFVSCDDNEIQNMRALLDDIFGEKNFIATAIWEKVFAPKNTARHFSQSHEYVIVYAKNSDIWLPRLLPRTAEMEARYGNLDDDKRGLWASDNLTARNYYGAGTYAVTCPASRVIDGPPPGTYWRVSKKKFNELDKDNRIWWGAEGNNMPRLKRFLSDVMSGSVPQTLWTFKEVGHTQESKKELISLVNFPNSDVVFDTPKPTRLIRRILQLATTPDSNDIVVDFFAGTGSTMDAVFRENVEGNNECRCILVQLPEPIPGAVGTLQTIADITKDRLRRAGAKVKAENPLFVGDTGFRVFKLDNSNIRAWNPDRDNLAQTLFDHEEHLLPGRSEADILYELLLKLGLDLCVPITKRSIAGKDVHAVGGGVLMACLAEKIAREDIEALTQGIVAWHKELAPAGDTTCVFRDSAFVDDVAKTNLAAILEQHGIKQVRSL